MICETCKSKAKTSHVYACWCGWPNEQKDPEPYRVINANQWYQPPVGWKMVVKGKKEKP